MPQDILQNENIEIRLFLEAINLKYGYDFRNYAKTHVKRRIKYIQTMEGFSSISQIQHRILYDPEFFSSILHYFSISTTEMFRDPDFYLAVRREVVPVLEKNSFIRIWHAGCSTGEEVYSLSIILEEAGLTGRTQIYATDYNIKVLKDAESGIFPIELIKKYTNNYQAAGGKEPFSCYYTAKYNSIIMKKMLKQNILFSAHNLVTDSVFNEMNLIFCRNVMIYFNKSLKNKVLQLFYDSLPIGGILCLGNKESLKFTDFYEYFTEIVPDKRIYQKIK